MPGEILDCPPCGAELTLAGWDQHTGAWCAVDLSELLSGPDMRGDSVLVEAQDGRSARARRPDETAYTIPMVFSGAVDRTGSAYADADAGRASNLLAYRAQVVTGQVIAGSMTYDDGTVESGDCIAEKLTVTLRPGGLALASLRLVIPKPWEPES